jgi:ABC-type sugar transport system substrate-binding protein
MFPSSKTRRAALAAIAVGGLISLAACGGDASSGANPAAGSSSDAGSGGSGDGGSDNKTIAFSPIALSIPAMKGLSEGVTGYGKSQGYKVIVQDPNLDPQKQVTDLTSVVESGAVAGAWAIMIAPPAAAPLVQTALAKHVPLILNGTPADYGLDGLEPGISFSTIDYVAQGTAMGEELGNCINEKLDGKAKILYGEGAPGTAGKEEQDKAIKAALAATAPEAEIVSSFIVSDRAKAQTDVGAALQGNPDITAVMGQNDEGSLGALGAFAAAGKELPCLTETGGNDEVLAAVKAGKIYASVALQFQADMAQSFDALVAMIDDPEATGVQLTVPQEVVKADS